MFTSQNFYFYREMPLAELKNKYRKLSSIEKARSGWEDEYEVSSKQVYPNNDNICITVQLVSLCTNVYQNNSTDTDSLYKLFHENVMLHYYIFFVLIHSIDFCLFNCLLNLRHVNLYILNSLYKGFVCVLLLFHRVVR